MKFHDYHLRGYSVTDGGKTITLDLVASLMPTADVSHIRFSEVAVYHFTHLGGAIISDVFETTFLDAAKETAFDLANAQSSLGGLPFSVTDNSAYERYFTANEFRTWLLVSAIGFKGFIVARTVQQE